MLLSANIRLSDELIMIFRVLWWFLISVEQLFQICPCTASHVVNYFLLIDALHICQKIDYFVIVSCLKLPGAFGKTPTQQHYHFHTMCWRVVTEPDQIVTLRRTSVCDGRIETELSVFPNSVPITYQIGIFPRNATWLDLTLPAVARLWTPVFRVFFWQSRGENY